MKKLLFIAVAAMFAMCANAQNFGITVGLNESSFADGDYDSRTGFNLGVKLEADAAEGFYYEGSALFSRKGYEFEQSVLFTSVTDDVDLYYLEVPINLGYKFNVNDNFQIAPKAGIYLAGGLFGNDDKMDCDPFADYNDKTDGVVDDDNRFDAGLGIGANFWIARHFEISTGYEFGLVKVNKDISDDSQNRNFYDTFAYIF